MSPNIIVSICRLCFETDSVFVDAARDDFLTFAIKEYLQYEVFNSDPVPWIICHKCKLRLQNFDFFKKRALFCSKALHVLINGEFFLGNGQVVQQLPQSFARRPQRIESSTTRRQEVISVGTSGSARSTNTELVVERRAPPVPRNVVPMKRKQTEPTSGEVPRNTKAMRTEQSQGTSDGRPGQVSVSGKMALLKDKNTDKNSLVAVPTQAAQQTHSRGKSAVGINSTSATGLPPLHTGPITRKRHLEMMGINNIPHSQCKRTKIQVPQEANKNDGEPEFLVNAPLKARTRSALKICPGPSGSTSPTALVCKGRPPKAESLKK